MTDKFVERRNGICLKSLSGKHLFMPLEMIKGQGDILKSIYKIHGVKNPLICVACQVINDLDEGDV